MNAVKHSIIILLLMALEGCSIVNDTNLMRDKLNSDSQQQAITKLQALAESGYFDAQLSLADHYASSSEPDVLKKAEYWYDEARPYSDKAQLRYIHWLAKFSEVDLSYSGKALTALRERQDSHSDVGLELVRFFAVHDDEPQVLQQIIINSMLDSLHTTEGDIVRAINALSDSSLYVKEFNERCARPAEDILYYCLRIKVRFSKQHSPDQLDNLVDYIKLAYKKQKLSIENLTSLVRTLASKEPGSAYMGLAYAAAEPALDNDLMFLLLANLEQKEQIGMEFEPMQARLNDLHNAGHQEASLILGGLYDKGKRLPRDPWKAEKYLAAAPDLPKARNLLGQLYLSGSLGEPDLQGGVDLMLSAARHDYSRAYRDLARVFGGSPGVKKNPIFSHVFYQVYQLMGGDLSLKDHEKLSTFKLDTAQRDKAEKMVTTELKGSYYEADWLNTAQRDKFSSAQLQ